MPSIAEEQQNAINLLNADIPINRPDLLPDNAQLLAADEQYPHWVAFRYTAEEYPKVQQHISNHVDRLNLQPGDTVPDETILAGIADYQAARRGIVPPTIQRYIPNDQGNTIAKLEGDPNGAFIPVQQQNLVELDAFTHTSVWNACFGAYQAAYLHASGILSANDMSDSAIDACAAYATTTADRLTSPDYNSRSAANLIALAARHGVGAGLDAGKA